MFSSIQYLAARKKRPRGAFLIGLVTRSFYLGYHAARANTLSLDAFAFTFFASLTGLPQSYGFHIPERLTSYYLVGRLPDHPHQKHSSVYTYFPREVCGVPALITKDSRVFMVEMPGIEPGCRQCFLSRFTLFFLFRSKMPCAP